jgi:hypothetical protein
VGAPLLAGSVRTPTIAPDALVTKWHARVANHYPSRPAHGRDVIVWAGRQTCDAPLASSLLVC